MKKIILALFILSLVPTVSWAVCPCSKIGTTYSCVTSTTDSSELQDCIDVADDGDTITLDAGTGTWTSQVTVTKALNIIGDGMDNTIINSNYSPGCSRSQSSASCYAIHVNIATPADNPVIRISGFTLDGNNDTNLGIYYQNSSNSIETTNVRFDNLKLLGNTGTDYWTVFQWYNFSHGVMDSSEINGRMQNLQVLRDGWNTNNSAAAYEFGDTSVMVFEDNVWTGASSSRPFNLSGNGEIRYVVRYNDITLNSSGTPISPLFDQHVHSFGAEIYGNDITIPNEVWVFSDQRGGKWLFYNNLITYGSGLTLRVRMESETNVTQAFNSQAERIAESYYWSNWRTGGIILPVVANLETTFYSALGRIVPLENSDFWNYDASFDGTTGIGCGTLVNRPATCTEGVGYWATDQSCTDLTGMVGPNPSTPISGTLYKCTSTNTWTAHYTPLEYPHPLTTGSGNRTPKAPTNPSGN